MFFYYNQKTVYEMPISDCCSDLCSSDLCFPYAGGIMGGSHISALKLIGALDQKKYRPLIVLHDDRGQFADFLRAEGVAYEHAPTPWHLAPASRAETIG